MRVLLALTLPLQGQEGGNASEEGAQAWSLSCFRVLSGGQAHWGISAGPSWMGI